MRILLPKSSKGLKFDLVCNLDMNDFDVEMLLPVLFHMVRTRGKPVGKPSDPSLFSEFRDRLAQHARVQGFSDKKPLLARWLRTSVLKIGLTGRARERGEQILFFYPLTMLTYKAGLPKEIARLRGVHYFIYPNLVLAAGSEAKLDQLFRNAFGQGLGLDEGPAYDGRFDGVSDMDIEAMLSICFLDVLQPAGVGPRVYPPHVGPQLRKQASLMARDILRLIDCYAGFVSGSLLTRMLVSLINFHLFVYTMRLMAWVCQLADETAEPANPEFYADCTGDRGSCSDELARECAERDLETLERYARALLRLRTLDRFASASQPLRESLPSPKSEPEAYLRGLLALAVHPQVAARAEVEFDEIQAANGEETEAAQYLQSLKESFPGSSFDRLVYVLYEAQRKSALKNLTGWFHSTSGFNRSYGLLSGNTKGSRRISRYTMSNELLEALVHVAFADQAEPRHGRLLPVERLPLRTFLEWLSSRFGLLVSRPPSMDRSVDTFQAARDNLEAFRVRLRQIGVFRDLSDDFEAQYLRRPAGTARTPEEHDEPLLPATTG